MFVVALKKKEEMVALLSWMFLQHFGPWTLVSPMSSVTGCHCSIPKMMRSLPNTKHKDMVRGAYDEGHATIGRSCNNWIQTECTVLSGRGNERWCSDNMGISN